MKLPQEWTSVLNKIQDVFPRAIIAGGCIRDTFYGRPVKDVDIFIPIIEGSSVPEKYGTSCNELIEVFSAENTPTQVMKILADLFDADSIELVKASTYSRKDDDLVERDITAVFRIHNREYLYEIIVGSEFACSMSSFDLSICQCMYDGKEVYYTDKFLNTAKDKVIHICNINRNDRQAKRLQRMLEKYPDFTDGGELVNSKDF